MATAPRHAAQRQVALRSTLPLLALALTVLLAGCSGSGADGRSSASGQSPSAAASPAEPTVSDASHARPGEVSLSFTQLRLDENSDRAQLRVGNGTAADLEVSGIGLDWPGYGTFVQEYAGTVPPGRVLDLRLTLPHPHCASTSEPVVGVVRLADGQEVRDPLDASGTGFVSRIWRRQCDALFVQRNVALDYGRDWRIVGRGTARPRLRGTLVLHRGQAVGPVRVVDVQGTVIFDLALRGPAVLRSASRRVAVPLEVTSFRCDDHAVGESSQTFHFRYVVQLSGGRRISALRLPPARVRDPAQRLITLTCS